jgi:hypothetical protein
VSDCGIAGDRTAVFRTPDDRLVVALTLAGWAQGDMSRLIVEARAAAADAVWVQGFFVDSGLGFERRGGYARLQADRLADKVELASPPDLLVRALQSACYRGSVGPSRADRTGSGRHIRRVARGLSVGGYLRV